MNTKLLTSAGCLLMLAATMSPGVLGHDERAALPGSPAGLGTFDKGVSGVYIGAAGPAIAIESYTNPDDTLATGGILCDAEVVVDSAGFPANEEDVDNPGDPASTNSAAGGSAENTVDDGGQGGACHVATYQTLSYNTEGCLSGKYAGGYDVTTVDTWLAATCDYETVDDGNDGDLSALVLCLANEVVLQTDAGALEPCLDENGLGSPCEPDIDTLAECLGDFVDCTLDPTCQEGTVNCGADGFADGIHFGYGSGAGVKAAFPTNPCPLEFTATSAIFVWEAVVTNGGTFIDDDPEDEIPPVYVPGTVAVYPATVGDVWTDNAATNSRPACTPASATQPAVLQFSCMNGTVKCNTWTSTWNPVTGTQSQCLQ